MLKSERALAVEPLVSKIANGKVGAKTAATSLQQYNSRLSDTLERGDKVRHILEGELMKRQQLSKDLQWLTTWLEKSEKELSTKVTGAVEEDAVFNEVVVFSLFAFCWFVLHTLGMILMARFFASAFVNDRSWGIREFF